MDSRTKSWLSYITWIPGLIFFLSEKDDKTVRVHAAQSMILGIGLTVILIIFGWIPVIGWLVTPLVWLLYVIVSIACAVKAYQGDIFKIPYIIDYAEKIA